MSKKRATPTKRPGQSIEVKAVSQDVKAIQAEAKALLKRQRQILKNSGKTIREFRHEFSLLRSKGVISRRKDARSAEPTKYYRAKLRKFADVISGRSVAVKAPKSVRAQYVDKYLYEQRGGFLIVPKEHEKQRTRIVKGLVEIRRPLGRFEVQEIVLPYNATDMLDLANKIERDPKLAEELDGVDQYSFKLFGHKSIGFPNKSELVRHIKVNYNHLFSGLNGHMAVRHFVLVKYGGGQSVPPDLGGDRFYSQRGSGRRKVNPTGRSDWIQNKRNKVRAEQAAKRRDQMTPAQKEEYQAKARARAKASYERMKKDKGK